MTIEIKRVYGDDTPSSHRTYTYKDKEDGASRAAQSMSGLALANYTLIINEREYPWPKPTTKLGLYSPSRKKLIEKHIRECIDFDKAFYEKNE